MPGPRSLAHTVTKLPAQDLEVVVAIEEAIAMCKKLGVEVPELSEEVSRLVTRAPTPPLP